MLFLHRIVLILCGFMPSQGKLLEAQSLLCLKNVCVEIKFKCFLMLISLPYELFQEAPFPLKQFVLMGL